MKTKHRQCHWRLLIATILLLTTQLTLAGTAIDHGDPSASALAWEETHQAAGAEDQSSDAIKQRQEALLERAWSNGSVPIIVRFKNQETSASATDALANQMREAALVVRQQRVLDQLGMADDRDRAGAQVKRFSQVEGLALQADALDLMDLFDQPGILEVFEDVAYPPALIESVPLIGSTPSRDFMGYSGLGQTIAILDTGVDTSHAFLTGKVLSEGCYSSNNASDGATSLCPGGVSESIATGSGSHCPASLAGCDHGTHVAGIAAGNGNGFSGVAKDAKLISIQVYSKFPATNRACGGAPCVMAYTSDIIKGLERVHALRNTYAIAAANLSLGGGAYTAPCDGQAIKTPIDNLLAAGIATVIASGNGYYSNAISSPGCVSTAVTVGSTTKSDQVSDFSNSAYFLDLLAPGSLIQSSVIGGGFKYWNGTSMAAPHVAGAWAVIKSAKPTASVAEILAALQNTGTPVLDTYNGLTKPRIEVGTAIGTIQDVGDPGDSDPEPLQPPSAPAAIAATGTTSVSFITNWSSATDASGYRLDVSTVSSFQTYLNGYRDLDVGNATTRAINGLSPTKTYFYRVRAYNAAGVSASSNVISVKTASAPPPAPTSSKATAIGSNGFTAKWSAATRATGYRLDIATDSGFSAYVAGFENTDVGNVKSFMVSGLNPGTTYYYRVRAYNAGGISPNSLPQSVTTLGPPPPPPQSGSATNTLRTSFQANWAFVEGASGYRLDVSTNSAFTSFVSGFNNLNVGKTLYRKVSGLKAATTYYYRVRAYSNNGTSTSSQVQSAKTAP